MGAMGCSSHAISMFLDALQSGSHWIIKVKKIIFSEHLLDPMRFIHAITIVILALMPFAQCQHTAEEWFNKGNDFYGQGKYDEAINAFNESIKINPNLMGTWNNKGAALARQYRYDEAIKALDEAIRIEPNYAGAWNNKGAVLTSQGNYNKAIKSFDEAIRLNTNYSKAWNNKGIVLGKQGLYDEAIKALDESIWLNPVVYR